MFWLKLFVLVALVLTSCVAKPAAIRELSEEEDFELERQLKLLNKPPVKTVEVRTVFFFLIISNKMFIIIDRKIYAFTYVNFKFFLLILL